MCLQISNAVSKDASTNPNNVFHTSLSNYCTFVLFQTNQIVLNKAEILPRMLLNVGGLSLLHCIGSSVKTALQTATILMRNALKYSHAIPIK